MEPKITKIKNIKKSRLQQLLKKHSTKNDILLELGISTADTRARQILNEKIKLFNLECELLSWKKRKNYNDNDIIKAVKNSISITEVLNTLGLTKHGNNFNTIRNACDRLNLSLDHFNSETARLKSRNLTVWTKENIFCENSKFQRGRLRKAAISNSILNYYHCISCGNTGTWNGVELKLQLDHINGINNDNRPINLRWLCPNCHSQTETFGT